MFQSRQVPDDCRRATQLADDAATVQDLRVHWVAAIALVRAVGHMLLQVDAAGDSAVSEANQLRHTEWRADRATHSIYWDFICTERSLVLKEYQQNWQCDPLSSMRAARCLSWTCGLLRD